MIIVGPTQTYAFKLDSNRVPIQCSEREKDVVRLRAYASVVWAPVALLPFLGGGTEKNLLSRETIIFLERICEEFHLTVISLAYSYYQENIHYFSMSISSLSWLYNHRH